MQRKLQAYKKLPQGLDALVHNGTHEPADVEARRTQHSMQRITRFALQPAPSLYVVSKQPANTG
jgi:hypothetical protein